VLDPYPANWAKDALAVNATSKINGEMLSDFEKIFNEWSEKIEQTLEEAEAEKKEDKEAGPRQELEYWKQRMRKLTCVSEQLRSKNCRTVFDVLTFASQSTNDNSNRPRDKIYLATSKWRSIELRVTEALNEAKDNVTTRPRTTSSTSRPSKSSSSPFTTVHPRASRTPFPPL